MVLKGTKKLCFIVSGIRVICVVQADTMHFYNFLPFILGDLLVPTVLTVVGRPASSGSFFFF